MSKLEEQKALPRRMLYRTRMLRPEPIIEALAAGTIALPNKRQMKAYAKRKAKKAKGKR